MAQRSSARRTKRILQEAAPHVGAHVIIIAPGCNGDGYLATSMSTKSAHDIEALMTMTNEALKKLRRWHRNRLREERREEELV